VRTLNKSLAAAAVLVTASLAGSVGIASASAPTAPQQRAFPALNGAPTKSVPASVSRFIDTDAGRAAGVDERNVYRLPAPGGGFWSVLPGDKLICVVFENKESISTCASVSQLLAGELKLLLISPDRGPGPDGKPTSPTDGPATEVGLSPGGVKSATAELASGEHADVQLTSTGLYQVTAGAPVSSITLHRAAKNDLVINMRWGRKGPKATSRSLVATAASTLYYFCGGYCWVSGSMWSIVLPIAAKTSRAAMGTGFAATS
jgi:hypothetical protein